MTREYLTQEPGSSRTPESGLLASTPADHGISEGERSGSDNEDMSPAHLPNGVKPIADLLVDVSVFV